MKRAASALTTILLMVTLLAPSWTGCVDYSAPSADGGVYASLDGGARSDPCAQRAFRGATPNSVVCPGTTTCDCAGPNVCCLPRIDSNAGTCGSLGSCRSIALQCDGPEDCHGGICCLDDRPGSGSTCRTASDCTTGAWMCRSDLDCKDSPAGPRCVPADFGAVGVNDRGLDGLVATCGR